MCGWCVPSEIIEEYGRKWKLVRQTIDYDIYEPLSESKETYVAVFGNQLFKSRKESYNND